MTGPPPPITFLSDYGLEDEFVGICHSVIIRNFPAAQIIDLGHGIPPGDVRQGAFRLANALDHSSAGIHMAVVDPGVGGARRPVVIRCLDKVAGFERLLIGPDNGLLWPAAEGFGGVIAAFDVAETPVRQEPVSATFHGRDIFAPVAAHLARGTPPEALGAPFEVEELAVIEPPVVHAEPGELKTEVLAIDRFGNASLAAGPTDLVEALGDEAAAPGASIEMRTAAGTYAGFAHRRTFADVAPGQPVLLTDSSGRLALAVNGADAGERFGLAAGSIVSLSAP